MTYKDVVKEVQLRMALGLAVGTGNTYTYSVRDPRSDRERYMRAAPIDLRQSDPVRVLRSAKGRGREDEQNDG
jgi:hypothetical protein